MAGLEPGAIFAQDFKIVRPLEAGGMGSVFIVEQTSTGNLRALKLMHATLVADAKLRERFLQEARVGARIQSDHVVQVIAAGIEPRENLPWLVMELLQGEELEKRVKRDGPLPRPIVLEVMRQLCHALSAAHAVGVVHRDLKPNNLFLCKPRISGAPFLLKVLDFGIAKVLAEAQTTGTSGMGTPLWMAPEQTEAKSRVGPQTDIWALGLLVYWMLTGKFYWAAAAEGSTSVHAILRELLVEPIVPASHRAATMQVAHLLPPGFDTWFAKCVERSLDARYPTADHALADLARVLDAPAAASAGPMGAPTSGYAPVSGAYTGANDPRSQLPSHPGAAGAPSAPRTDLSPGTPMPGAPYGYGGSTAPGVSGPGTAPQLPPGAMPGYGAAPGTYAQPPAKSSSSSLLWIGIAGLALVGGGGLWAVRSHHATKHAAHDDDDDRPRHRDKKSAADDGAGDDDDGEGSAAARREADCKALLAKLDESKKRADEAANAPDSPGKLRNLAGVLDRAASDIDELKLKDRVVAKRAKELGDSFREVSRIVGRVADAAEAGNLESEQRAGEEMQTASKRADTAMEHLKEHCSDADQEGDASSSEAASSGGDDIPSWK